MRKLSLILVGMAMLSKSLFQFSADGWGCIPDRGNRDLLQKDLGQHVVPPRTAAGSVPDPTADHCGPKSAPETPKLAGKSGSVSCGVTVLSPGSWCTHGSFCAFQESLFP